MRHFMICAARLLHFIQRASSRMRMFLYRSMFLECGDRVVFDPSNSFFSYSNIRVGSKVFIGGQAWFSCSHGYITIGSYVMFGPGVKILGGNHRFSNVGLPMYEDEDKEFGDDPGVTIGSDVWVGANSIILPGVHISDGAVIAAGSVVNRDVPAFTIVAGVPAKVVKMRFEGNDVQSHINALKEKYGLATQSTRNSNA